MLRFRTLLDPGVENVNIGGTPYNDDSIREQADAFALFRGEDSPEGEGDQPENEPDDQDQDPSKAEDDPEEIEIEHGKTKLKVGKDAAELIRALQADHDAAVKRMHEATREAAELKKTRREADPPPPPKSEPTKIDLKSLSARYAEAVEADSPDAVVKAISEIAESIVASKHESLRSELESERAERKRLAEQLADVAGDEDGAYMTRKISDFVTTKCKEYDYPKLDPATVRAEAKAIATKLGREQWEPADLERAVIKLGERAAKSPPPDNQKPKEKGRPAPHSTPPGGSKPTAPARSFPARDDPFSVFRG